MEVDGKYGTLVLYVTIKEGKLKAVGPARTGRGTKEIAAGRRKKPPTARLLGRRNRSNQATRSHQPLRSIFLVSSRPRRPTGHSATVDLSHANQSNESMGKDIEETAVSGNSDSISSISLIDFVCCND